jgi:hypothetical protein
LETGKVPFVERPMSESVTLQELWTTLQGETTLILPEVTEFNVFKGRKRDIKDHGKQVNMSSS